jgi:diguanylate cyclase (GGDEF)-like protein
MPAIDYVSIVRSVYGDRRALLFGAFASAAAASASALHTGSRELLVVALAFVAVGFVRFQIMNAFQRAEIGNEDAIAAEYWENMALFGGSLVAALHGIWCLVSILIVQESYAEFAAATLSMGMTVGIVARNFGLDRLVTIQTLLFAVPLSIALLLRGDFYHGLLAALLIIMLVSFRKLAGDVRDILLAAVHGRVDASRLAAELDIALTTMNHGVVMLDRDGAVSVVNERAHHILKRLQVEVAAGSNLGDVLTRLRTGALVPTAAIDRLSELVATNGSGKVLLCLPAGRYYEVTVSSRRDRSVLLFEDISERVQAEERISYMARHDALTTLSNRSHFTQQVREDLSERVLVAKRGEVPRVPALLMIDIDDFKHVNDSMGHMVGDNLLIEVSQRLQRAVPADAMLARLGGDEFVVYVPSIGDVEAGRALADAILAGFERPFDLGTVSPIVTASVGIVISTSAGDSFDGLLAKADLALYRAKSDGKRKSQLFHAGMDVDYQYRQRLKFDLGEAVANDQLTLAFQPLVDLATTKVVSCEALARWTHPTLGIIPPSTFIPLAEEMGLVSDITAWVLRHATAECAGWPSNISVAVNISGRDFQTGTMDAMIDRALADSGLPPHRLELEVTETSLIEHRDSAISVLRSLSDRGIAIALDDFGTGYSSLSYLQALPFTKLKIDRSFVENITTDSHALMLLANVAQLGTSLNMCVIAEGVETEEQLETIRAHTEVSQVQGYLLSRPLPARDISELIARFNAGTPTAAKTRKHG